MVCKMCQMREKTWKGDDPRCAFRDGPFGDNWNCSTVGCIRIILDTYEDSPKKKDFSFMRCGSEENYATINVSEIENLGRALALWVQWYKNRGSTETMLLMFADGIPPRPPTEEEVVEILKAHGIKTVQH